MTTGPDFSVLSALAQVCTDSTTRRGLLGAALPLVLKLSGAHAGLVISRDRESYTTPASAGFPVATTGLETLLAIDDEKTWTPVPVPATWAQVHVTEVRGRRLPGAPEVLLLAGKASLDVSSPALEVATSMLVSAVGRLQSASDLADLVARVDNAQRLANMGDYDWNIATDTNTWSDQLYRIYGHEPQSFNASYERFLSLLHPDDRERIMGVHQTALGSGETYQMIERVVRPSGEMRYLSSNGQVVMDETGTPVRMRGTCIDITDRVLAEDEKKRSTDRFRALVESMVDGILVLDGDQIVQANPAAMEVLGGDPVGRPLSELVTIAGAAGQAVPAVGVDGRQVALDFRTAPLSRLEDDLVAVFLHDAAPRLARESLAANLREVQVRQRQAVEINDNIVQSLTAASYALEADDTSGAGTFVRDTLTSARRMMNDLMEPLDGQHVQGGDLVRSTSASSASSTSAATQSPDPDASPQAAGQSESQAQAETEAEADDLPRVLIVDDSTDLRTLLRLQVERKLVGHVVGEAVDGHEGVALAESLQPDLILLDLAMPRMDGLQALPLIREVAPRAKVIMLSGFDQQRMAEQVLAAGADRYVEKGTSMARLVAIIQEVWVEPNTISA